MLKWLFRVVGLLLIATVAGAAGVLGLLWHYGRGLPDYQALADYQPATTTRVHAGDGRLLAEYATERRIFVPIRATPHRVIQAFLAAEDKNFYNHPGIDPTGILRALATNVANLGQGRRLGGGSTITQQVAKNMLLGNEMSLSRKAREAILAVRIERVLSKDRILELYLNEIYLGAGAYGVAAAALNYFSKPMGELSIAETAFLAALPKAPNNYNPQTFPDRAKARRDWVIDRMADEKFITAAEADAAKAEPLATRKRDTDEVARADYFAEEVRRQLLQRYGETALYKGGLSVRTSLDPRLQAIADRVLRQGLIAYDRRHGYRGPVSHDLIQAETADWNTALTKLPLPPALGEWQVAVVMKTDDRGADIGLRGGAKGRIPFSELLWARPPAPDQKLGPSPKRPADVIKLGDVVLVEPVEATEDKKTRYPAGSFGLRQIPEVSGAVVVLDPHTGRVLSLTGGLSFEMSQFNRATQAMRQPGSSFKPFVYMAALDNGFTPASLILDAPFVLDQGNGLGMWKPQNYTERFYGPTPMRVGIEQSRNLMTVRLAESVGMAKVADYAERFGTVDHLPQLLSMALGATETTLLRMTTAYGMIVNGGKRISPSLIDRVQDRDGKTVFRQDSRPCGDCGPSSWASQGVPVLPDPRETVVDPTTAYQMVSMLQGVVERGSGSAVRAVGRPLAGKTGTTNDFFDAWFIGFSPDLVAGVFVGFDQPRTLGRDEAGARISAPIFRDFMAAALADQPIIPFRIPPGIKLVRVNPETGQLAQPGETKVILEAFKPGTEPNHDQPGAQDAGFRVTPDSPSGGTAVGVGGLY